MRTDPTEEHRLLTLLCVHPHPDDESIACGGVLARYAEDPGVRTAVVVCTGGEEGENLAGIDLGDVEMTEVRIRELSAAMEVLAVDDWELLGYRDSGMADQPSNAHPGSFVRADLDKAAGRLARIIRRLQPDVIVSDDELGTYGHPDHVRAHEVVTRAVELAADPGWSAGGTERGAGGRGDAARAAAPVPEPWQVTKRYVHALPRSLLARFHERMVAAGQPSPFGDEGMAPEDVPFGVPDETITTSIDVTPWLETKRKALRAHASQIGEDSFFLNLPDDLAREVFGHEHFVLEDGPHGGEWPEDDLFAGLRWNAVPEVARDRTNANRGAAMETTEFTLDTSGQRVSEITDRVRSFAREVGGDGLLHVFLPHATAGLALMETGAGSEADLEDALERLFPRDDRYVHAHGSVGHGGDHLLPVFVSPTLVLLVRGGEVEFGTWQSVVVIDPNRENDRRHVRLSFLRG
jgi:N-acetyl-1-D-myo-inositol-2-amino-2-deoxy-alpha-D-glucopyranoside deacetylase